MRTSEVTSIIHLIKEPGDRHNERVSTLKIRISSSEDKKAQAQYLCGFAPFFLYGVTVPIQHKKCICKGTIHDLPAFFERQALGRYATRWGKKDIDIIFTSGVINFPLHHPANKELKNHTKSYKIIQLLFHSP